MQCQHLSHALKAAGASSLPTGAAERVWGMTSAREGPFEENEPMRRQSRRRELGHSGLEEPHYSGFSGGFTLFTSCLE
jgi:hypothetical protein